MDNNTDVKIEYVGSEVKVSQVGIGADVERSYSIEKSRINKSIIMSEKGLIDDMIDPRISEPLKY